MATSTDATPKEAELAAELSSIAAHVSDENERLRVAHVRQLARRAALAGDDTPHPSQTTEAQ